MKKNCIIFSFQPNLAPKNSFWYEWKIFIVPFLKTLGYTLFTKWSVLPRHFRLELLAFRRTVVAQNCKNSQNRNLTCNFKIRCLCSFSGIKKTKFLEWFIKRRCSDLVCFLHFLQYCGIYSHTEHFYAKIRLFSNFP